MQYFIKNKWVGYQRGNKIKQHKIKNKFQKYTVSDTKGLKYRASTTKIKLWNKNSWIRRIDDGERKKIQKRYLSSSDW